MMILYVGVVLLGALFFFVHRMFFPKLDLDKNVPVLHMYKYIGKIGDLHKDMAAPRTGFVALTSVLGPRLVATHPDTAKAVLKNEKNFPKMQVPSMFGSLLNDSLLFTEGDMYSHQKQIMSPAFHWDFIRQFIPMFISKTEEALGTVKDGRKFNAKLLASKLTLDILGMSVFGKNFNTIKAENSNRFWAAYQDVFKFIFSFQGQIFAKVHEWLPTSQAIQARKDRATLFKLADEMAEGRAGVKEPEFLVDMLLADKTLSKTELQTNCFLFFFAGHDTTSHALGWAFWLMSHHQDVQKRLIEEVDSVTGGEPVKFEHIKSLSYMDMFIREGKCCL